MKKKIKAGDEVVVISGEGRGKRGKVIQVIPARERIIVEGVNLLTFKERPSADSNSKEIKRIEREAPIHISNVMPAERHDARQAAKTNG